MLIIVDLSRAEKRRLRVLIQRERDAAMRTRLSIILHCARGRGVRDIADATHVARSTVYRIIERFIAWGLSGLADRREDNGPDAVSEIFLLELRHAVSRTPQDFGWSRPTWTQELLILTMEQRTGRRVRQSTMSRCLRRIGARLGRPRPTLACPWAKRKQNRRLREIWRLIEGLRPDEVVVYVDEVDIHLNPKIGSDWMLRGQQKTVLTPGKNVKRYIAGAMDAKTRHLTWVSAVHKRSGLFIDLLRQLERAYTTARVIHVIADNYCIHDSRQTRLALEGMSRVRMHFLPPYSPKFNLIERVWLDLHAEVTRNHRCADIEELIYEVTDYLKYRNRNPSASKAVA